MINFGAIDIFDGPNDLDLTDVVYAINTGAADNYTVGGVQFLGDSNPIAGYATNAGHFGNWSSYAFTDGSGPDNAALNSIMQDINCCGTPYTYDLNVTAGAAYKLQLLWGEGGASTRIWDIEIEGAIAVDEAEAHGIITGGVPPAPASPNLQGTRYSYTFTAPDSQLNIRYGQLVDAGGQLGADRNSVLSAIVLSQAFGVDNTLTWDGDTNTWGDLAAHGGQSHWTGGASGEFPTVSGIIGDEAIVPGGVATVAAGRGAYSLEVKTGGAVNVGNNTAGTKTLTLLTGADVLAASTLNVRSDGVLDVPAVTVTDGALDVAGTVQAGSLDVTGGSGSVSVGGTLDVALGTVTVGAGAGLTVAGGGTINADVVDSAGTTNFQSGSLGTVGTVNVTGGVTTLSSPTITTINASSGTLHTAASVTNLNVAGATADTTGAVSATNVNVSSGSLTLGADLNVSTNMTVTSNSVNAGSNFVNMANGSAMKLDKTTYTATTGTFKATGTINKDGAETIVLGGPGSVLTVSAPTVPTNGLLGMWTFDDDTPNDSSGQDNHGTASGGGNPYDPVSYTSDTGTGSGRALDLTGGNKAVWVDTGAPQNVFDGGNAMTIATWAKGNTGTWAPFICKGESGWQVRKNGGGPNMDWTTRGLTSSDWGVPNSSPAFNNTWHFIVMTYDGSQKKTYIFGADLTTPVNESINATGTITARPDLMVFGARDREGDPNSLDSFFNGLLDDIYFYDRAISFAEAEMLYGGGSGPATDSTVALTNLTGAGTIVGTLSIGGTVGPGSSIGTINVTGDFELADGAVYDWEINNTGSDLIAVDGALDFGATATLNVIQDGAPPATGQHVLFSATGAIDTLPAWTINLPAGWSDTGVSIDGSNVVLNLSAVPEPSTLLLALIGLLGIAASIRRRKR